MDTFMELQEKNEKILINLLPSFNMENSVNGEKKLIYIQEFNSLNILKNKTFSTAEQFMTLLKIFRIQMIKKLKIEKIMQFINLNKNKMK